MRDENARKILKMMLVSSKFRELLSEDPTEIQLVDFLYNTNDKDIEKAYYQYTFTEMFDALYVAGVPMTNTFVDEQLTSPRYHAKIYTVMDVAVSDLPDELTKGIPHGLQESSVAFMSYEDASKFLRKYLGMGSWDARAGMVSNAYLIDTVDDIPYMIAL